MPTTTNHPNRGAATVASSPTPDAIRDLRMAAGLSVAQAAMLVLATKRGWEGWEADEDTDGHRRMPAGLWLLFRARLLAMNGDTKGAIALLTTTGD